MSDTYVSVAFLSSFAAVELLHRLDLVLACVCVGGGDESMGKTWQQSGAQVAGVVKSWGR